MLAEFESVVDAIRCAVEIQRALASRNTGLPIAERAEFRLGVNVGDVIVEDGDLYGDGVNVAARLEQLAEPGTIYVSGDTYRQTKDKLDEGFADLGEHMLKNIAEPVRIYRIVADARSGGRPMTDRSKSCWHDRPSRFCRLRTRAATWNKTIFPTG